MLNVKLSKGFIFSFLSAFLYALNVPISKYYLNNISSNELLFLLYFGSAVGILLIILLNRKKKISLKPSKAETPYILGVVLCDIFAALLIVESLRYLNASTVSLLSILEIGATIIFSFLLYKNKISINLILSVIFVTLGGGFLSIDSSLKINFSLGIMFVLLATILWGLENNLTAKVSNKNPSLLVFYKCLSVSLFNFLFIFNNSNILNLMANYWYLLIIGFFTYGISILSFAFGTKFIGASKTAIIFSLSPIFSTIISIILFKENINIFFVVSLIFMIIGIYYTISDNQKSN